MGICDSCRKNDDIKEDIDNKPSIVEVKENDESFTIDKTDFMNKENKFSSILDNFNSNKKRDSKEQRINVNYSSFCNERNQEDFINEEDFDKISQIDQHDND